MFVASARREGVMMKVLFSVMVLFLSILTGLPSEASAAIGWAKETGHYR